jgi:integrase
MGFGRGLLKHDIVKYIGDKRMKDIKSNDLQELLNIHKSEREETIAKIRQAIQLLFGDAVHEGIIERDPSTRLDLPELEVEARRPLTPIERQVLLNVCKTHPHGVYVLTMLYTGLRRSECIALLRSDIDFDKQTATRCCRCSLPMR